VVDSAARIGGDTVVLGGNAVYETDESISGSAYVLGGHISHVGKTNQAHRMSVGPGFFWLLAVLMLILLSALIVPLVRRRTLASSAEFR
jgi:hypothetical protein